MFGDEAFKQQSERSRKSGDKADQIDPNLIPLGQRPVPTRKEAPVEEPIPDVEWWDAGILLNPKTYEHEDEGGPAINQRKITIYIEHPVPLEPPVEGAAPPPMPLPLTTKASGCACCCLFAVVTVLHALLGLT